jgi:hypothetical protein
VALGCFFGFSGPIRPSTKPWQEDRWTHPVLQQNASDAAPLPARCCWTGMVSGRRVPDRTAEAGPDRLFRTGDDVSENFTTAITMHTDARRKALISRRITLQPAACGHLTDLAVPDPKNINQ